MSNRKSTINPRIVSPINVSTRASNINAMNASFGSNNGAATSPIGGNGPDMMNASHTSFTKGSFKGTRPGAANTSVLGLNN